MNAVIAFSLWGNDPKYTVGAVRNAELAETLFPGWSCRYYIGSCVDGETIQALQARPNTHIVAVDRPGDWTGMFWRFLPCSDPAVDVMLSRDTDSRLSAREAAAVRQWLDSGRPFHIMRDHPHHNVPILGGMWGCRRGSLPQMAELCRRFVKADHWQIDQTFLRRKIYPLVRRQACVHDEFFEGRPFPTPRRGGEFVGEVFDQGEQPHQEHRRILRQYLQSPWELPPLLRRTWLSRLTWKRSRQAA